MRNFTNRVDCPFTGEATVSRFLEFAVDCGQLLRRSVIDAGALRFDAARGLQQRC